MRGGKALLSIGRLIKLPEKDFFGDELKEAVQFGFEITRGCLLNYFRDQNESISRGWIQL